MRKLRILGLVAGTAAAAAMVVPRVARAVDSWQESQRQAWIEAATAAIQAGGDALPPLPWGATLSEENPGKEIEDDPESRTLQQLLIFGARTPEYQASMLRIAQQENAKTAAIQAAAADPAQAPLVSTVASTIVAANIGPAGARSEYNGSYYNAQDTGRVRAIRVHPTDPNTVYIATTGGGVWKTTNFHTAAPSWTPLTDGVLGSIDLGAMDIDPQNPSVIYVGTGEHGDSLPGGAVMKSTDGGATWQTPVLLTGVYTDNVRSPPVSQPMTATQVRGVIVDPNNSNVVMAATDVGLFRSIDAGATFAIVDLPNLPNYTLITGANPTNFGLEGAYDVVYLGAVGGVSQFMVSGDYACPNGFIPSVRSSHVPNCAAATSNVSPVTTGTFGDIWKSTDAGASWSSMRVAGKLPTQAATWGQAGSDSAGLLDLGRIGIASAPNADPSVSTVYAVGSTISDAAAKTNLLFNTRDGGTTWNKLATPLSLVGSKVVGVPSAPGAVLTNPTTTTRCNTMDVGHTQSWYNIAIAVDPGDPNRAITGGNFCGLRTIDGGLTWQNAAYWLPTSGTGDTIEGGVLMGPLGYVHADWHTALISRVGGRYVTFAGSDGGIFASYDVFDKQPVNLANWSQNQYGIISQLPYGHGTGDPVFGNANVLWMGFQDNGTRWRLSNTENVFINTLLNYDQIQGGDGTGNGAAWDPNGQNQVYWAGLPTGPRTFCRPANRDCSRATTIFDGNEFANWFAAPNPPRTGTGPGGSNDTDPFTLRYSPTYDTQSSIITGSTFNVWKAVVDSNDRVTYTRLTPSGILTKGSNGVAAARNVVNQHVFASPWTYTINGAATRLYGVCASGGTFLHIFDNAGTITTKSTELPMNNGAGVFITGSASIAYFRNPANLSLNETDPTKAFIVGTNSIVPGSAQAPTMSHLLKTTDNGLTWTSIFGNNTPAPSGTGTLNLPNVPIYVVRIDYSDPTEKTWFVGTELGLYRTLDGGDTWARYGNVPAVRVIDLTVSLNGNLVRASTYGRGIWEAYPHSEANSAVADMDWDKNGVIDFRDTLALASRIGKTPAMNDNNTNDFPAFYQQPRYDAAVDANGDGVIDSTDLTTLMTKFGGAP